MAGDGKISGRESRSWYKGGEDGGVSGRESWSWYRAGVGRNGHPAGKAEPVQGWSGPEHISGRESRE
ncbi:hypothetical protein ACTQ1J_08585 [Bilifractor sp. LCP21S3_A8]